MKWLLISNNGNPGDIWVRLGVEKIIRRLDPNPKFFVRERDYRADDKHNGLTEPDKPLDFDYSVLCGMPVLWSHTEPDGQESSTVQHASWEAINGWCSSGGRMIVAGFGILLFCPEKQHEYLQPHPEVVDALKELFATSPLVYSRTPMSKEWFPEVGVLNCPSVLSIPQDQPKDLKLCNFMPGGGHYPQMAPGAAKMMEKILPEMNRRLQDDGYLFMSHNNKERAFARSLDWPRDRVRSFRHCNMLDLYSRCSSYFGNRIHGAIMARAVGAPAIVIGYDTRLAAARSVGACTFTPQEYSSTFSKLITDTAINGRGYNVNHQWNAHLSWWSTKLKLPILDQ